MKKFTLFLFFTSLAFAGFSTTWTVTNSNFSFTPATITIQNGDSVRFTIANIHTVVEVSQATWNNNDNDPLSGGFQLGSGGGLVLPADLTPGTHWYVCGPHASMGMKGIIIVESTTGTEEPPVGLGFLMSPNPANDLVKISWTAAPSSKQYQIDILDINGKTVYTTKDVVNDGINQHVQINLSSYPEGTYIVRLQDEKGVRTKKLILQ
jgi:plastocyanin